MDGDRKYRQHGYQDSSRDSAVPRIDRPKQQGPRAASDAAGPKLPRLVQNVVAARCFSCATALPPDIDFKSNCPKCAAALHCCKQCSHFEPATRFQCLKLVPVRIVAKDLANECALFSPRVTVARDGVQAAAPPPRNGNGNGMASTTPRTASDARAAFNSLFKK